MLNNGCNRLVLVVERNNGAASGNVANEGVDNISFESSEDHDLCAQERNLRHDFDDGLGSRRNATCGSVNDDLRNQRVIPTNSWRDCNVVLTLGFEVTDKSRSSTSTRMED